jgi:hypothetical protein
VVHRSAESLPSAAALAALAVLSLRTVLLVATTAALPATPTTEVAAPATAVALAPRLLCRLAGGNSRSVTAGLWWGRKVRLFREIRFVVHYFLRYGGQVAEIVHRGAVLKFQYGWVSKICPARKT